MARAKPVKRGKVEDFVLDGSMAIAWSFEDETDDHADRVLAQPILSSPYVGGCH